MKRAQPVPVGNSVVDLVDHATTPWAMWFRSIAEALVKRLSGTHAERVAKYPAGDYMPGVVFFESDRTVYYLCDGLSWNYLMGTMTGTTAQRPSDLVSSDAGFRYFDSQKLIAFIWSGSAWAHEFIPGVESLGSLRATGNAGASFAGQGVELTFIGGAGYLFAYNRDAASYLAVNINASLLALNGGTLQPVLVSGTADDGTGCKLQITGNVSVSGNKVLGSRGAAVGTVAGTAGATYTATEQGLINSLVTKLNAMEARLNSTTGHGLWA